MNSQSNLVVISDVYGQRGGAYRVTSLLCQALAETGHAVTCFSTWVDEDSLTGQEAFDLVRPAIRKGSRWDVPNRVLAQQAVRHIRRTRPAAVFVIGLTKLSGYLLNSRIADQLFIWELTNANPNNKFVCDRAAARLNGCRAVLSPAATIDAGVRDTYGFTGNIHRLPFWIEDEGCGDREAPADFRADFLFLARREDDKGLRELIDATAMLRESHGGVRVLIAGPGSDAAYRSQAERLGLTDEIEFCSLPSRSDAMQTLAACRWLVLPSYHEGYPLSLLEAAQYSVPIITTDVGSIREVFGTCAGTTIVPPRDAAALAAAMREQLDVSDDDYAVQRKAVHQRFQDVSSRSAIIRQLTELVQRSPAALRS